MEHSAAGDSVDGPLDCQELTSGRQRDLEDSTSRASLQPPPTCSQGKEYLPGGGLQQPDGGGLHQSMLRPDPGLCPGPRPKRCARTRQVAVPRVLYGGIPHAGGESVPEAASARHGRSGSPRPPGHGIVGGVSRTANHVVAVRAGKERSSHVLGDASASRVASRRHASGVRELLPGVFVGDTEVQLEAGGGGGGLHRCGAEEWRAWAVFGPWVRALGASCHPGRA